MKTRLTAVCKKQEKIFLKRGAVLEHKRWAKWQNYIMTKLFRITSSSENEMTLRIPTKYWKKWKREIKTPYAELSEEEKEKDREQTRVYIPMIRNEKIILIKKMIEMLGKFKEKHNQNRCFSGEPSEKYKDGYNSAIADIDQGLRRTLKELE